MKFSIYRLGAVSPTTAAAVTTAASAARVARVARDRRGLAIMLPNLRTGCGRRPARCSRDHRGT